MNDTDDVVDRLDEIEREEKVLRKAFTQKAWDLIRAQTDEDFFASLTDLRKIAAEIKKPEQERRDIDKLLKEAGVKDRSRLSPEERHRANLEMQAEIHRQALVAKQEQQEINSRANREAKRLAMLELDAMRAKKEQWEYEKLASEERRRAIIQKALGAGDLLEVFETEEEKAIYDQMRSGGGIIRIETGSK